MLPDCVDLVIIGAGPAGLMAAIQSYNPSTKTVILEQMHRPALKLKISGKGRCNITNSARIKEFLTHFGKNGKFLRYAFGKYFNNDLLHDFRQMGVEFKLERGGRYFPEGDNAMEIVNALLDKVEALRIPLITHCKVLKISKTDSRNFKLIIKNKREEKEGKDSVSIMWAKNVLLATGGKSYSKTGSDGSGYKLAAQLGHTIMPITPSLVPIVTKGDTANKLQGLSLRNVNVSVWHKEKKIREHFGEMVFTDFGLSGPVILSLSSTVIQCLQQPSNQEPVPLDKFREPDNVRIIIDLKPALDHKKLDHKLIRMINEHCKQQFKTLLKELLPRKIIPVFIEKLKISEERLLNQISAEERKRLRLLLKEFSFEATGYRSFDKAIVTSGGICIKEIDPQTMGSKQMEGLFFAGEVIDIDADTGGFNLQAAFSTAWLAGHTISMTTNSSEETKIKPI